MIPRWQMIGFVALLFVAESAEGKGADGKSLMGKLGDLKSLLPKRKTK